MKQYLPGSRHAHVSSSSRHGSRREMEREQFQGEPMISPGAMGYGPQQVAPPPQQVKKSKKKSKESSRGGGYEQQAIPMQYMGGQVAPQQQYSSPVPNAYGYAPPPQQAQYGYAPPQAMPPQSPYMYPPSYVASPHGHHAHGHGPAAYAQAPQPSPMAQGYVPPTVDPYTPSHRGYNAREQMPMQQQQMPSHFSRGQPTNYHPQVDASTFDVEEPQPRLSSSSRRKARSSRQQLAAQLTGQHTELPAVRVGIDELVSGGGGGSSKKSSNPATVFTSSSARASSSFPMMNNTPQLTKIPKTPKAQAASLTVASALRPSKRPVTSAFPPSRGNRRGVVSKSGQMAGGLSSLMFFLSTFKVPLLIGAVFMVMLVPLAIHAGRQRGGEGGGGGGSVSSNSNGGYLGIKPNFVLIFPDDMSFNDVNFTMPNVWRPYSTPNLDQLAFSGIILTSYYSTSTCTPARCGVLTGRYIPRTGCYGDADLDTPWGLPLTEYMLPQYLAKAGYYNAMFGKWHLGAFQKSFLPTSRGFDHFVGFLGGGGDWYSHTDKNGYDWWYDDAVDTSVKGTYASYIYNASVQNFITQVGVEKQPWFIYLPTKLPHGDYTAPQAWTNQFTNKGYSGNQAYFFAEVTMLDDLVGSIVRYLKQSNQYENTIIVYAGDHAGDANNIGYDGSLGRAYPWSGGKGNNFEGGVRCPAFVHSPLIPKSMRGSQVDLITSVYDWLPTFAALAGAPSSLGNEIDGWNLAPLLFQGKSISNHNSREVVIALKPCNYYSNKKGGGGGGGGGMDNNNNNGNMDNNNNMDMDNQQVNGVTAPKTAIRIGNYKMHAGCVDPSSGPEWARLYDIVNDPTESTDLLTSNYNTYSSIAQTFYTRLMYFASTAANPNDVCNGCSSGCSNNGYWGPFYDEDWNYLNYCNGNNNNNNNRH